ncbi:hypothetical protein [Coleofasciculus sp. F4-SAH-05]|uniref:hypothetical protein n=2 Tax=Coleofasciculaceae TaxID=1892251 RepID=UPI0032F8DEB9
MFMSTLLYLNHYIRIEMPNPDVDNTIYVSICRASGTYDPDECKPHVTDYQLSAKSPDPNDWIKEAMDSAIATLDKLGVKYYNPKFLTAHPACSQQVA